MQENISEVLEPEQNILENINKEIAKPFGVRNFFSIGLSPNTGLVCTSSDIDPQEMEIMHRFIVETGMMEPSESIQKAGLSLWNIHGELCFRMECVTRDELNKKEVFALFASLGSYIQSNDIYDFALTKIYPKRGNSRRRNRTEFLPEGYVKDKSDSDLLNIAFSRLVKYGNAYDLRGKSK